MNIGDKIKRLRKEKGMTLSELSSLCGVAVATLSRMENNKMTGTLKAHQAIAAALGTNIIQLYADMDIVRKPIEVGSLKNKPDIFVHNEKASYDMLTTNVLSKHMMPVMLKVARGGRSSQEELPIKTEKFIYILNGKCRAYVGLKDYNLKQGETLYFDGSLRHYFKNTGKGELRALCVITPPVL